MGHFALGHASRFLRVAKIERDCAFRGRSNWQAVPARHANGYPIMHIASQLMSSRPSAAALAQIELEAALPDCHLSGCDALSDDALYAVDETPGDLGIDLSGLGLDAFEGWDA
jgi:hypothetical protein